MLKEKLSGCVLSVNWFNTWTKSCLFLQQPSTIQSRIQWNMFTSYKDMCVCDCVSVCVSSIKVCEWDIEQKLIWPYDEKGCCIHGWIQHSHKRSVLSIIWLWIGPRIGGIVGVGDSLCESVAGNAITSCLNHSQSFWKPVPAFPVRSILLLLEFLSSTSSADSETKFWFAFLTDKVREPFRFFSFGSSNDSCETPFPIPMSDTEYMFDVLVGVILVPQPILKWK